MKKIVLLLLLCGFQFTNAQCPGANYFVYNSTYALGFSTTYPNCHTLPGALIVDTSASLDNIVYNLDGMQGLTAINGSLIIDYDLTMTSLHGLENITSIGGSLIIKSTQITDISALSNLTYVGGSIEITGNSISSLAPLNNLQHVGGDFTFVDIGYLPAFDLDWNVTNLPGSMIISAQNATHYDGLGSLTNIGGGVEIHGTNVTSLAGFQNVAHIGGTLEIDSMNNITSLVDFGSLAALDGYLYLYGDSGIQNLDGMQNLTQLGGLRITNCPALSDFTALSNVATLGGELYIENSGAQSLAGLDNITTINGDLSIYLNAQLTDITALQHLNPSTITELLIYVNPLLSVCNIPNLCYYLEHDGPVFYISNNAEGCNSQEQVELACNVAYKNTLTGTVTMAYNNTCAGSFTYVSNKKVTATSQDGTHSYSTFTDHNGVYTLFVPAGTYTVLLVDDLELFSPMATDYSHTFPAVGASATFDFCLVPDQAIDDVRIRITPISVSRPGFEATYNIVYQNVGTTVKSGTVTFQYDAGKMSFVSVYWQQPVLVTPGLITWEYNNMAPFETQYLTVRMLNAAPPTCNIDDVNNFVATIYPLEDDHSQDNTATINQVVIGSYDPNDKMVYEGSQLPIADAQGYLTYRVRFQNTGTASAINVRVEDQMDDKFDWSTFSFVGCSHFPFYRVEFNDGKMIVFLDNVYLPAQVNDDAGSNGYVLYRIKPKPDVAVGDVISNTADIYFDFNTPIVTNTVTTQFIPNLSTPGASHFTIRIYPNPVKDVLHFETGANAVVNVVAYNNLGQKVASAKNTAGITQLDMAGLAAGVYHCHFTDDNGNAEVHKVVVSK